MRPLPSECRGNGGGERARKEGCYGIILEIAKEYNIKGTICVLSGAFPDRVFFHLFQVLEAMHCYEINPETIEHLKPFFEYCVKPKLSPYIPIEFHEQDILSDNRKCDILDFDTNTVGSIGLYDKIVDRCHTAIKERLLLNVWTSRGRAINNDDHNRYLDYLKERIGKEFTFWYYETNDYEDSYPMSCSCFVIERRKL